MNLIIVEESIQWSKNLQVLVVRGPISANPRLNFKLVFIFFRSKAFSQIISFFRFRAPDHQIADKINYTEFAF